MWSAAFQNFKRGANCKKAANLFRSAVPTIVTQTDRKTEKKIEKKTVYLKKGGKQNRYARAPYSLSNYLFVAEG